MAPKKKSVTKKKTKPLKKGNNSIDVTKTGDIPHLSDILKKNKFTIVLIWADYCGHCHTYKREVWNKLLANKNRKAGMASIHYDQLETTPDAIPKKVSGYPTVLFIGNDGVPMKFKDENTGDSTMEYPKSRDVDLMTKLIESEDPERSLNDNTESTPALSSDAEILSSNTDPDDVLNSISEENEPSRSKIAAPNPSNDMLNSQNQNRPLSVEKGTMDSGKIIAKAGGGSLYKSLLEIMNQRQTRSVKRRHGRQTRRSVR
jgi:thiol-disulfide isomerase/thioredoxin